MNFEFKLIFLIKPFLLHNQKVITISWERKEFFRWNKTRFLPFLKGFQWNKKHKFFGRWESVFNETMRIVYFPRWLPLVVQAITKLQQKLNILLHACVLYILHK